MLPYPLLKQIPKEPTQIQVPEVCFFKNSIFSYYLVFLF